MADGNTDATADATAGGRTRWLAGALLAALLACVPLPGRAAAGDDWGAMLAGGGKNASAETGVVGMSADDAESYVAEEQQATADEETPQDFIRGRRRFVMREMRFNADWDTDPTGVPAFVDQYKRRTGLDAVALQPRKPLSFDSPDLIDWPIVYMTAHNAFTMTEADVKSFRNYFLKGGFLFVDDCLFGFPFGQAFPGEMSRVLPEAQWLPIDPKDPVFGVALKQMYGWAQVNEAGLPQVFKPNSFMHMDVGGRMVLIYTTPDMGCLWEISSPPSPANPLGGAMHGMDKIPGLREASYRMGVNIVIYSMLH